MKRIISRIMLLIVACCFSAWLFAGVEANTIKSIMIDVLVNPDGSASVTEVWDANLTQGTEGYKTLGNLDGYDIKNFRVSDETQREYEVLSYWNVNNSFSQKEYRCGIHKSGSQLELCWGISKYGDKTYTLKYDITGFVKEYTDSQGIYFSFIAEDMDQKVNEAKVVIHSDEIEFNEDNSQIWAFGYPSGTIEFEDGTIVMDSKKYVASDEYLTALIKINDKVFDTNHFEDYDFNTEYEDAMSDVKDKENDAPIFTWDIEDEIKLHPVRTVGLIILVIIGIILSFVISLAFNPVIWFIIIFYIAIKKSGGFISSRLKIPQADKVLPADKDINYYRDIPCNKKITRAYWLADNYTVTSTTQDIRTGLVGAYLLKLIREKRVSISKTKAGLFSFKDNNYAIDLTWLQHGDDEIENKLIDILIAAAGSNKILETKEFSRWCGSNYTKVNSLFTSIDSKEEKDIEAEGFVEVKQVTTKGLFGKEREVTTRTALPTLRDEAIKLKGLKKFLLDFSLINQREAMEVHLWDEYLIFANILGIADKVEEQFSKLYPDFKLCESSEFTTADICRCTANFSRIGIRAAESAARSSSSGGVSHGSGGHSHSGGGHSSGGHSHGGGFR